MKKAKLVLFLFIAVVFCFLTGCSNKFYDPTQIGRFRPTPAVNVILDSLGVAEEEPSEYEDAEEPKPIDLMVFDRDHRFAPGDVVRVSIYELLQQGITFTNEYVVTETGKVSIPEVGVIEAEGLTESQLENEIKQILSPGILKDPSVTVVLMSSQQRTFSILGEGTPGPGRYNIPRTDFRLTDALATAGGVAEFNVSNIYVSRIVDKDRTFEEETKEKEEKYEQLITPEREMLDVISPRAESKETDNKKKGIYIVSSEMISDRELEEAALPESFAPMYDESSDTKKVKEEKQKKDKVESREERVNQVLEEMESGEEDKTREFIEKPLKEDEQIEWVFKDGKWVPVKKGKEIEEEEQKVTEELKSEKIEELTMEEKGQELDWTAPEGEEIKTRVIKIPVDKLLGGDPKYDIIVRPGDTIEVRRDIVGEFFIGGNVNNQGVITLTGRPMTLKMAIAAAGGLGPLAWPKRCEVIRRIGEDKEEIVMVDLDKIASGEQPDFFIKPNDLINVGTHPTSRWRAVLRNAFRATYGFGFIYDRNFADVDFGTRRPFSSIF